MDIEIDLPVPVSVNLIWRKGRGRKLYLSTQYVAWRKNADALMLSNKEWRTKQIPGRYKATLILNESMLRPNQDIDNLVKVPIDYARRLGLIIDDSVKYCRQWTIKLGNDESAPQGCRLILQSEG